MTVTISVKVDEQMVPVIGMSLNRQTDEIAVGSGRVNRSNFQWSGDFEGRRRASLFRWLNVWRGPIGVPTPLWQDVCGSR